MKIVADENISDLIVEKLRSQGHDVTYIRESAKGSLDPRVLAIATADNALLITNDKDFGELVYYRRQEYSGVLLLRLSQLPLHESAAVVAQVVQDHGENLLDAFTVIKQRGRPRIRKRSI